MTRTMRQTFLIALWLGLVSFLCAMAADCLPEIRQAWVLVTMRLTGIGSALLLTVAIIWAIVQGAIREGEDPDDDR